MGDLHGVGKKKKSQNLQQNCTQCHTTNKWQGWDVNQRSLTPEPILVTQNKTAFTYKNARSVIHGKGYVIQMENYID